MKKLIGAVGCALIAGALSAAVLGLAPTASASGPYANCTQAHNDGRYDIPQGDPDYWPAGDPTTTASPVSHN
jgi:hypothetical protein